MNGGGGEIRTHEGREPLPVFRTTMAFATSHAVCGLDHAFAIANGLRREPSDLYTFRRRRLGSALPRWSAGASPNLIPDTRRVSPLGLDGTRPVQSTTLPHLR